MNTFQDRLAAFEDAGASVCGVSIDTPFSLDEFRRQNGLEFPIVSDSNREVVTAYGVAMDMDDHGVANVAKRSVFVVDGDGVVTYRWVSGDPTDEPDYDEVLSAAANA
jgi:peroxiredoxin